MFEHWVHWVLEDVEVVGQSARVVPFGSNWFGSADVDFLLCSLLRVIVLSERVLCGLQLPQLLLLMGLLQAHRPFDASVLELPVRHLLEEVFGLLEFVI